MRPSLTLGAHEFNIETLKRAADGSIPVPPDKPDTTFWIEGTNAHFVFALSPTADNLALKSVINVGDPANIAWGDCSTDDYRVSGMQDKLPDVAALLDQTAPGMTIFVPSGAAGPGFVIAAQRPQPQAAGSPEPTAENAVQAELTFSNTVTAPDGKTLTITLAVKNNGAKPLTLAAGDISLTVEGAPPVAPLSVAPALPQTIAPDASLPFEITFPKPAGNTATFKLLDFSSDIYF